MEKLQTKIQNYLILTILFLLPVYLVKIRFGWISFNALELLIASLFILWIFNKDAKHQILDKKYKIPIFLIFIGLFLSTISGKDYYTSLGAIKGWFIFPIIFGIVFFDALKKDETILKKSLLTLFFSGTAVSAIGIVFKFFGNLTFDGRLKIFWDSPNQLAMFLAIPFLIGLFFTWKEKKEKRKKLYILCLALIGLSLLCTFSYGAWLAIGMAIIVITGLEYGKIIQKKYLAIFLLILLIFLGWAIFSKYKSVQNTGERSSLASRFMIWKSSGRMIESSPFFGIGPGNFQEKYLEYQKYFPPYLEWSAPQPHNIFLAFWLESGLAGLIGFVCLLILFFRDNKIAIKNNRDLGILFLAIMIYVLIHGLVDTTYWRNDLAVVFWVVILANYFFVEKNS